MDSKAILGLSVLLNFVAFGTLARLYISPRLQIMHRDRAIAVLVAPHMFRFVGLSFLMPGVVSAAMPRAFAVPAAYGDLLASILAIVAMLGLASRAFWALGAVWLMNVE